MKIGTTTKLVAMKIYFNEEKMERRSDCNVTSKPAKWTSNSISKIFRSLMSVKVTFVHLNNDINDNITI